MAGNGGLTGSGGVAGRGGVAGTGGSVGAGGTVGTGGSSSGGGGGGGACSNVLACGGDLVGTWTVTSSCLSVTGQMDMAVLGLGCTSATVTGSLQVTGTWTAKSDGTYSDNTTTSGDEQLKLPASCLQISGTITTCDRIGGVLFAAGYDSVSCISAAGGGCTCSAAVDQIGWMGVVNLDASTSGEYTTSGTVVTLDGEAKYSFCVAGDKLSMTPQGTSPTTTGTVVFQKSGSTGSGGAPATGGSGGRTGSGGVSGSGGVGGTGGTTGSSGVYGMACTSNLDCPSDAVCCDGSDESCDGSRLPSGDGANPGEFVVSADGLTVRDTITGLIWQRDTSGLRAGCSDGQDCIWEEAEAYCASLVLGGLSGWRLPAAKELVSIVDFTANNPAIDPTAFPNTSAWGAWTSSPCVGAEGAAWAVNVGDGNSYCAAGETYQARCVRGSRCYPVSRLAAQDGGLIRDTLTNLVWPQQVSTTDMTWEEAQTYCSSLGAGFRLPTVKELGSILDLTRANPIYQTDFPSAAVLSFWTSTTFAGSSGAAWDIDFSYNTCGSSGTADVGSKLMARCVR